MQVSEIVDKTIQGEGPFMGQLQSLVRLPACNLRCVWCDTLAMLDRAFEIGEAELLQSMKCINVMVTGGEPTFNDGFGDLMSLLEAHNHTPHVETNGMFLERDFLSVWQTSYWSISPKLKSSGMDIAWSDDLLGIIKEFLESRRAWLKFVVQSRADLEEAEEFIEEVGFKEEGSIFIQTVDNERDMFRYAIRRGPEYVRYTCQIHKLMGVV